MTASFIAPLWQHAQERPQQLAVWSRQATWTWASWAQAVESLAEQLRKTGLRPGQRVVLRAADGPGHLLAALAVLAAGGVHVPVDWQQPQILLRQLCEQIQAQWFYEADSWGQPKIWQALATDGLPDPLGAGQSAFIRYSSGTTGAAKGVLLSHAAIAARADAAISALDLQPGDAMLWVLPLAYHFAVSIGACLRSATAVVFAASLRASGMLAAAQAARVSHAYLSPWHATRLSQLAGAWPAELRQVLVTTAAISSDQAQSLRDQLRVPVRQALGIIEVGLPLISPGLDAEPVGFFGPPAPAYQLRICDPQGRELPPDTAGELRVSGPGLFDAYIQPWRPASALCPDGFFASGDAAKMDSQGRVQLLGRLKSLINVGGMKVFPLAVESVLAAHPQVLRCRVSARPDPRSGERVHAAVQAHRIDDCDRLRADLEAWCAERLAPLDCPSSWSFEDLPLTGSGKVRLE